MPPIAGGWIRKDGEWFHEAVAIRIDEAPHSTSKPQRRDYIMSEILLVAKESSSKFECGLPYVVLAGGCSWTYQKAWYPVGAVCLGLWHQLSFFVHDMGHMGVMHNCIWGLGVGWWVDNRNIQHPSPAIHCTISKSNTFPSSPSPPSSLYSSYCHRIMKIDAIARIFFPFQHNLYDVAMPLAHFNIYANSDALLMCRARRDWTWPLEILGIAF